MNSHFRSKLNDRCASWFPAAKLVPLTEVPSKGTFTLYRMACRLKTLPGMVYKHLSDIWFATLEFGAAQVRSVTVQSVVDLRCYEKLPFLCVNKSPVRYGFRVGEKAAGRWGGGGVLPYKRLMRMCRWMGSHFHDWIDYNGVAHFLIFWVRQFFIFTVGKRTRTFAQ